MERTGRSRGGRLACAAVLGALAAFVAAPAGAATFAVRITENNLSLGGDTFKKNDIVLYDSDADTATILLGRSSWSSNNVKVDAFHLLADGTMVVSHSNSGTRVLGGLAMKDGDVALYDPVADVAVMLLSEAAFNKNTDVDAAHRLPNGNLLISIQQRKRTLGGITFRDGDVVEYDPVAGTVAVVFSEDLFDGPADVDGVQQGSIVLTTRDNGVTLAGLTFDANDIVSYDTGTGTATLVQDGSEVPAGTQLFGVYLPALIVPEPPQTALLLSGIAGLLAFPSLSRWISRRRVRDGGR